MVVSSCGHELLLFREWEGLVIVIMVLFNGLIKTIKKWERQGEGSIKAERNRIHFKKPCSAFALIVEVETKRPCGCRGMQPRRKSTWIAFLCL